jgi:hypothetical protein
MRLCEVQALLWDDPSDEGTGVGPAGPQEPSAATAICPMASHATMRTKRRGFARQAASGTYQVL